MLKILHTQTTLGRRTQLDYQYHGKRYRPTLGYNLTPDRERELALQAVQEIHEGAEKKQQPLDGGMTFSAFIPTYLQRMRLKGRVTIDWTKRYVIDQHLIHDFGALPLRDIRLVHGENYIERRRNQGAAAGTVERECNILSAIMNCAVDHEYLERNRLKTMTVPKGLRRERVASPEELQTLLLKADRNLKAAILVAINTGLRESKIAETDQSWIRTLEDGAWLFLPKARTLIKGNPDKTPLNGIAVGAMKRDVTYLHGKRIFDNWHTGGRALSQVFTKLTRRCGIQDLTFHDLRHTFSTALENLDIGERTIDLLMGHKIPDTGERYRHGGPGRDRKLREAVSLLENHWKLAIGLAIGHGLKTGTDHVIKKINSLGD